MRAKLDVAGEQLTSWIDTYAEETCTRINAETDAILSQLYEIRDDLDRMIA
jgi:hypothetical protein